MSTFVDIGDYPGRGVLVRRRSDGDLERVYFVTGRRESSRRRRAPGRRRLLHRTHRGTQADPLRHYACARPFSEGLIVGNGDHVDVLVDQLDGGVVLEAALTTFTPEPDPPINTPRIGAVIRQRFAVIFSVAEIQGAIERRTTELPTTPHDLAVQTTYAVSRVKELAGWNAAQFVIRVGL